jgi:hypothetical protein
LLFHSCCKFPPTTEETQSQTHDKEASQSSVRFQCTNRTRIECKRYIDSNLIIHQQQLTIVLSAGDILELLHDYGDGWAECTLKGKQGLVPISFYVVLPEPTTNTASTDTTKQLKITVIEGKDLEVKDLISSDPFCVVKVGNQEHKTRVLKNNLNPKWSETFTFQIPADQISHLVIKFAVLDYDRFTKGMHFIIDIDYSLTKL